MLTAADIIEGAYYAMDQAGQLLSDSLVLYNSKRWPSSLVLAVFALEELGKAETLLDRARDASKTGPKTKEEVMNGLAQHRSKLKSGRGPLTIQASVAFWGDVPAPGTPEEREIMRRLEQANQIAREHAPREDHAARMKALYVDLGDGDVWQRPSETTRAEAYLMLSAAAIEYGVRREKFVHPTDAGVKALMERVPPLPEAPQVNWPRE
jgi:AbiV family abortive infection protein